MGIRWRPRLGTLASTNKLLSEIPNTSPFPNTRSDKTTQVPENKSEPFLGKLEANRALPLLIRLQDKTTQHITGVSSSTQRATPPPPHPQTGSLTHRPIVMRPLRVVAAVAQGWQERGGARGYSALERRLERRCEGSPCSPGKGLRAPNP